MIGTIHQDGDVVGTRYKIVGFVGQGGMQEVYQAEDLLLAKVVALKAPKNNSAKKRFKRSAVVSAKVNHANVAKTLDYLDDGKRAYLIEEFITGKDLSRVLKEDLSLIDPHAVARLLHHLARGLAASHHAGVIHRDLKPSNVMAVGGALLHDVKITDFGIAKMAEEEIAEAAEGGEGSLTASQTAIGALPYMAPEMINSMKDADKPADVWSLGAMTYELLTGNKPFGAGLKAVSAIQRGVLPALPYELSKQQFAPLAQEILGLVQSCIQLDPKKRPTADQLTSACESLCYPPPSREFGIVNNMRKVYFGFIDTADGQGVFFHRDSLFGANSAASGEKVVFTRYPGEGNDRAFPVSKLKV
jgi:eukaryotic-like serine/threonine-protein kinase